MAEPTLRILFVCEDRERNTDLAQYLLHQAGFQVDLLSDSELALSHLGNPQIRYDLVIIDDGEEKLLGAAFLKKIWRQFPQVETILMSSPGADIEPDFSEPGTYQLIYKPVGQAELLSAIQYAVRHQRLKKTLQAVADLSAILNSSQNLSEVLEKTCQAAVDLFLVDHSGFVSFDDDQRHGICIAEYPSIPTNAIGEEIQVIGVEAEERLVHQKKTIQIYDIRASDTGLGCVREKLAAKGIQSILIVPIQVDGKVIASFSLDMIQEKRRFSRDEINLCQTLSNQVAVAIQNARYFEEVQKMRRAWESAQKIAKIDTEGDLDSTLKQIVEIARHEMNADIVTLYTYNQSRDEFVSCVGSGYQSPDSMIQPKHVMRNSSLRRVLELTRLSYHSEDPRNDPIMSGGFVRQEGVEAAFGMPLRYGQDKVGVLFINYRTKKHFKEYELKTFEQFGHQAAISIHTAQLKDQTQKRMQALEGLFAAGEITKSADSLEVSLKRIAQQALRIVCPKVEPEQGEVWFSHITLQRGRKLDFVAAWPESMLQALKKDIGSIDLIDGSRKGIIGRAILEGKPQNIGDTQNDPDFISHQTSTRSQITVLLEMSGRVIGALSVESSELRAFSDEDLQNLSHLASHAAQHLQGARQFSLMQGLLSAGQDISNRQRLQPTLEAIAGRLQSISCCDLVSIYTYNAEDNVISYPSVIAGTLLKPDRRSNPDYENPYRRLQVEHMGKTSVIRSLLAYGEARFSSCAREDEILGVGDFVKREKVDSSAGIPLKVRNEIVGLLFLNYRSRHEFTQEEIAEINVFAHYIAIAIQYARQSEELVASRSLVRTRTDLASLTMKRKKGLEGVEERIRVIKASVSYLKQYLKASESELKYSDRIAEALDQIQLQASHILKITVTPPPLAADRIQRVAVNKLVQERIKQIWENEWDNPQYQGVRREIELSSQEFYIEVSPEWLRYSIDLVIDVSMEQLQGQNRPEVWISTINDGEQAKIVIVDNGRELKPEARTIENEQGMGIRLLIAETIIQTYGGKLEYMRSEPMGNEFTITLPLARRQAKRNKMLHEGMKTVPIN